MPKTLYFILLLAPFVPGPASLADDTPNGPWRFTTVSPAGNWFQEDFDDRQWQQGPGGFGEPSTPGSRVNTEWLTPDLWLPRTVTLPENLRNPALLIHHDEGEKKASSLCPRSPQNVCGDAAARGCVQTRRRFGGHGGTSSSRPARTNPGQTRSRQIQHSCAGESHPAPCETFVFHP